MGPRVAPPSQDSTEQEEALSRSRAEELGKGMLYNILCGFSMRRVLFLHLCGDTKRFSDRFVLLDRLNAQGATCSLRYLTEQSSSELTTGVEIKTTCRNFCMVTFIGRSG